LFLLELAFPWTLTFGDRCRSRCHGRQYWKPRRSETLPGQ
jgi:hypothetical protein